MRSGSPSGLALEGAMYAVGERIPNQDPENLGVSPD